MGRWAWVCSCAGALSSHIMALWKGGLVVASLLQAAFQSNRLDTPPSNSSSDSCHGFPQGLPVGPLAFAQSRLHSAARAIFLRHTWEHTVPVWTHSGVPYCSPNETQTSSRGLQDPEIICPPCFSSLTSCSPPSLNHPAATLAFFQFLKHTQVLLAWVQCAAVFTSGWELPSFRHLRGCLLSQFRSQLQCFPFRRPFPTTPK